VVFSKTGRVVWEHEVGTPIAELPFRVWSAADFTAPFSSGSARYDGMLVLPCSAGCMARIAQGISTDLVARAGDVMLKERRRLVLVLRELPLSLVHLRAACAVTEAGAVVMPASPSFYGKPASIDDLVDSVVGRALDLMDIDNDLCHRWSGLGAALDR
jgi:4-hydroxy-3-polyprenylbenzoate decarboxylase